jgi:hypothetical protein
MRHGAAAPLRLAVGNLDWRGGVGRTSADGRETVTPL